MNPASVTRLLALSLTLLLNGVSTTFAAEKPGHKTALFDGKTLHGWTVENGCKARVKDGARLRSEWRARRLGDGWLYQSRTPR